MKKFKAVILTMIIAFSVISTAGLALNLTSLFLGWKPIVVTEKTHQLSIFEQKPAETITPEQNILILTTTNDSAQYIKVATIVPNGETTFQVETNLNDEGDITTFTTGQTVWVEKVKVPFVGLLFYPFTSAPASIITILTTLIFLFGYRYQFYGKPEKPEPEKIDNIGMLQNIFDNAPTLTKKEAKRLSK